MTGVRVGVDYRILSVGRGLIRRGLGRFTQQQLRAVAAADPANEYVLLCLPGSDLSLVDPVIRRAANVSVRHLPIDIVPAIGASTTTRLRRSEQFQQWVVDEGIDLFHATTPFYPSEPMLSSFDACPMVATFYDAIPLLFPAHYFLGPADKAIYAYTVSLLRSATRLISISEASAQDAVDLIGIARERIDLAYPSVDEVFAPMAEHDVDRTLARLSRRVRIPSHFAFTVSYPHHSKNLENLLRAFARLPDAVRLRLPLVACCTVAEASPQVWAIAKGLGLTDDLVLTGPLSDEELAALYNRATFVVHPSRYEGFGLPVAEAMRCGAPVVTTTSSSLPEIAGDAASLVDPDDVDGMAAAMLEVYEDGSRRKAMSAAGLLQSQRFTAGALGEATLACYRRAVAPPTGGVRRPRLAVWSPVQPATSAGPTVELLNEMDRTCDVEVFLDDDAQPALSVLGRRPVHHFSAFERRQGKDTFDAVVYHVDDAPSYLFVRAPMARHPGVAVLHSDTWSGAQYDVACATGEVDRFLAELGSLEGPQAVAELSALPDAAMSPGRDFWRRYPMLGDVISASLTQVVHDPAVAAALGWRYPSARFVVVPPAAADPGDGGAIRRKSARADLGCDEATFVVALFGQGSTEPALESAIRSVAMASQATGRTLMLLAGAPDDQGARLRQLSANLGMPLRMLADRDEAGLAACDVAVCLRSGSSAVRDAGVRALAAARPVVWTEGTSAGGFDSGSLVGELRALRTDNRFRAERAAAARAEYEERHTVARSVEGYLEVIASLTGTAIEGRRGVAPPAGPDAWDEILEVLTV